MNGCVVHDDALVLAASSSLKLCRVQNATTSDMFGREISERDKMSVCLPLTAYGARSFGSLVCHWRLGLLEVWSDIPTAGAKTVATSPDFVHQFLYLRIVSHLGSLGHH